MKTVIIKVYDSVKEIAQTHAITKDGKPTIIRAQKGANYEFFDQSIDRAPNHIISKRIDNDLHISFERNGQETDLIIEDFYSNDEQALIGIAEDGEYYHYIPDTGQVEDYVTQLENGDIEGSALGGEHMVTPLWVALPAGGTPWWLGLGLVPLLFDKDDNDDPSPQTPNPMPFKVLGKWNDLGIDRTLAKDDGSVMTYNIADDILGKFDPATGFAKDHSIKLIDPTTGKATDAKEIKTTDGTWKISDDGTELTFAPATKDKINAKGEVVLDKDGNPVQVAAFDGDPTPINYVVVDKNDTIVSAQGTIEANYSEADTQTSRNTDEATVEIPTNDGNGNDVDPTSIQLIDPKTGKPTTDNQIKVDGEGTWTLNDGSDPSKPVGTVTFKPETTTDAKGKVVSVLEGKDQDPTPITYIGKDKEGNDIAETPIYVSYAYDDVKTGKKGQPITVEVTENDPDVDPSTVKIHDIPDAPVGTVISPDGKTATVPGEGTWTVNDGSDPTKPEGSITFTPDADYDYEKDPTPIDYVVDDNNGDTMPPVKVIVDYPNEQTKAPESIEDEASTPEDTPISGNVLENDTDPDTPQDELTVKDFAIDTNGDGTVDKVYQPGETADITDKDGNPVGTIVIEENGDYTHKSNRE